MALPSPEELQTLVADLNDAAQAYSAAPDLAGCLSRIQIIDKAKRLSRMLISPEQLPNYHGLNMAELVALRTFIKLKVLESIPETGSISLRDLAQATGAQESLLERMARILVATGFLDQTHADGGDYKHTKSSLSYATRPGPVQLFLAMYDEWFKNMHNFDDYLVARGQLANAQEPDNALHNPYTWTHKQDGVSLWAIMAQNPEKLHTFQAGMAGIDIAIPVVGHFDFGLLKTSPEESRMELIDVGGGRGSCLKRILETHPELSPKKCVLQDVLENIDAAKCDKSLPPGLVRMVHDFHGEQPIKGAKAYFMRMILHDYSDTLCVRILSQLAKAMAPDSRLLICEMVIPERVNEADFIAAVLDQAVMTMGGKERTQEGFRSLLEAAGLELVNVWRIPGVPGACVEGRLKDTSN